MKISIVMATYNGEKYIIEQLDSILQQSLLPDEVIICDDNSADSTVRIIKKFIEKHKLSEWKVYQNSNNKGYSANFSEGLMKATGDIIFLADQDDIWLPNKLEDMAHVMMENLNIQLLASNVMPFYMEGNGNTLNYEKFGGGMLVKIPFSGRWIKPIRPGCSFCIRRNLLNDYYKVWFRDYPHDSLLWGLANINNSSYLYNRNTIKFRRHGSNASSKGNKQLEYRLNGIKNEILIAENMLNYLQTKKGNNNTIVFINNQKEVYKKRVESLKTCQLITTLKLLLKIKYYGRIRYWFTDIYYIMKNA
ncbi:glycosyltransferase [Gracilibacillus sp. Marseille-QA3620]